MRAVLVLALVAGCARRIPAPPIDVPTPEPGDYSGLAPYGLDCVAVSDAKDPAVPRVFVISGGAARPVAGTDALPVDLEAITPVGGGLLVATGAGSLVAWLRVADGHATDIRPIALDVPPTDQIEGIAALPTGEILVGTRGGDVRGTLTRYALDLGAGTMTRLADPIPLAQTCGLADARDVADLAVAPDGQLWAVGAVDPGDDGPFASCAYPITLGEGELGADGLRTGSPRSFPGDKVEALAWCGGQPTAGTDNEALPERIFRWKP